MGMIDLASASSFWKGLDYYESHKVLSWNKTGKDTYEGKVSGSEGRSYIVRIDLEHPKRSTCTCPFADGRRVICKHMLALYFTAEPGVAEDYLKRIEEEEEEWEREQEEREREQYARIKKYVYGLARIWRLRRGSSKKTATASS